jgi:hypothetical protein
MIKAAIFTSRLEVLKNEQIELMKGNMRLKKNRVRKHEINEEFFAIKEEWREMVSLGKAESGVKTKI